MFITYFEGCLNVFLLMVTLVYKLVAMLLSRIKGNQIRRTVNKQVLWSIKISVLTKFTYLFYFKQKSLSAQITLVKVTNEVYSRVAVAGRNNLWDSTQGPLGRCNHKSAGIEQFSVYADKLVARPVRTRHLPHITHIPCNEQRNQFTVIILIHNRKNAIH